jgi:DNA-binding PadR family transcriptional regulator
MTVMAGLLTRMLVLGVVALFEPINGYQIRRELGSWGVEEWADLKAGSVYSMLTTLERQASLRRWDLPETNTRLVAVYQTTDAGRAEFLRLVRGGLDGSLGTDTTTFQTAMTFLPFATRSEALTALRQRRERLESQVAVLKGKVGLADQHLLPPHVRHVLALDHDLKEREVRWLGDFITFIGHGSLAFSGEAGDGWAPPPEDSGWEMVEQSRRYREQIATLSS